MWNYSWDVNTNKQIPLIVTSARGMLPEEAYSPGLTARPRVGFFESLLIKCNQYGVSISSQLQSINFKTSTQKIIFQ